MPACLQWRLVRRLLLGDAAAAAAPPGSRLVVDAGCGLGAHALFAAAHGCRAVCVEPSPGLQPLLAASLAANNESGHRIWVQARVVGAARGSRALSAEGANPALFAALGLAAGGPSVEGGWAAGRRLGGLAVVRGTLAQAAANAFTVQQESGSNASFSADTIHAPPRPCPVPCSHPPPPPLPAPPFPRTP